MSAGAPAARAGDHLVIGWRERVDLPEWGVVGLTAKIDTGARSSALHVDNIEQCSPHRIRFDVVVSRRRGRRPVAVEASVTRIGRVRSSTGHFTTRFFTTTRVRIGAIERTVDVSLVDRERLIHRMLLGRTALRGLVVDPCHAHLLS